MRGLARHVRNHILQGLLALIPLVLSLFVLHFIYIGIDQRVAGIISRFIGFSIPGLGILLLVLLLYLVGLAAGNVLGRQVIKLVERVVGRIPIVRSTYQVGKQLSATMSLPEKQVFKRAVLVDYLKPGIWTIGFVTGEIIDRKNNDQRLLKVYIPTPPIPTSGTMVLVVEAQTRDPGWTVEEAMRTVISGGIIGPAELK